MGIALPLMPVNQLQIIVKVIFGVIFWNAKLAETIIRNSRYNSLLLEKLFFSGYVSLNVSALPVNYKQALSIQTHD